MADFLMAAEAATAGQMQFLNVEQVNQIAKLADTYAAALGPNPDADRIAKEVESGSAPQAAALVNAIEALSRDARYELIALVWCGQGEYTFTEARAYAQATSDKGTAQYMAKKALILSGLLQTALDSLGRR
jgi:hypothetical protein